MVKKTTIDAFFKKRGAENLEVGAPTPTEPSPSIIEVSIPEHRPSKASKINLKEIDASSFERDPGLRPQIWEYAFSQRDQLRRAYIKAGPYQHHLSEYPFNEDKHPRRFQASWFKLFPDWLEYSPTKDKIFCLPCYLFTKPTGRPGSSAFIVEGFRSWKKVNDGSNCALLNHVGKDPNSLHKIALKCCQDLLNQSQHIEKILEKQTTEQIRNNRLRLETSIFAVKWLTFQSCPLRGHDESSDSINRGNFIEFVKALASHNEEIDAVVLDYAPQNAIYTSPGVQKDILYIFAKKIRKFIREEISDAKYCILVDESRDESKKEQMAIVLRFVDRDGFIRERFFDLVHVSDTRSMTLKKEISDVLSRNNLSIQNMRGQGYDGASNMRGEWNGLQALFSNECPFAYYIHCLAHRLQLALVAASRELKAAQVAELERKLAIDDLETGSGLNQVGTLKRAGDTRWGSHLGSLRILIIMFDATCSVLRDIISDGASYVQRGDADGAYDKITSFEFIFILHLMREIMEITDDLCQALQRKSQDILNAMQLVSSTKSLIQKFREDGCDPLFEKVRTFCEKRKIEIPDMSARYTAGRGRSRHNITMEHYFRVEVFTATIDSQIQELRNRFQDNTMELLVLSSALDPYDAYKSFNIEDVCKLANKFYPDDFTEQEQFHLKFQLEHYECDIRGNPELQKVSTLSELCQVLVKTRKATIYPLVDRLIRLVLTLPISTASTERAFSAMKHVKTKLRNKMDDEFLANYLLTYIEKEIARDFDVDPIIDEFYGMKERRAQLMMPNFSR